LEIDTEFNRQRKI